MLDVMEFINYPSDVSSPGGIDNPSSGYGIFQIHDNNTTNEVSHTTDSGADSEDPILSTEIPPGLTKSSTKFGPSIGTGVKQGAKRPRKTQACDRCRSRKVRCDANTHKPCSRCQRDRLDCIVHPHKGGKRSQEKEALKLRHELSWSINPQGAEPNGIPATPTSLEPHGPETMHAVPRYLFSETLKGKLVDKYVAYVHPLCPVIDVTTVQKEPIGFFIQQGKERLSPLVFLSILYSAVPHISMEFLRAEGYESRERLGEAIRSDFKLAQDCGVTHDWKALVHAFLLMGSWYNPGARSQAWEWCGAAAQLLDQHCDVDELLKPGFDHAQLRRLWWSCFIRDQLISLASQREPRMTFSAKIAMIAEKDMKTSNIAEPSNDMDDAEQTKVRGTRDRTQKLATWFVEFAKLSVILNRYFREETVQGCGYRAASRLFDSGKISLEGEKTVAELLSWYCRLHSSARYLRGSHNPSTSLPGQQDPVLHFHQALLLIPYYLTLVRANDHNKGQRGDVSRSPAASRRLDYACREVGKLLQDLIHNGGLRHVPTDLIDSLLPFATTILLDSSNIPGVIRDSMQNRIHGFERGLEVMRIMMTQKRHQARSQDDYRIALVEAICSLYVEPGGEPEDSTAGTEILGERSHSKNGTVAALATSTLGNEKDHFRFWPSPPRSDMLVTMSLANASLSPQHSEPASSSG